MRTRSYYDGRAALNSQMNCFPDIGRVARSGEGERVGRGGGEAERKERKRAGTLPIAVFLGGQTGGRERASNYAEAPARRGETN